MSQLPAECTVIITGAVSPRGIGRATADLFAERGWHVGIIDLDQSACERQAAELSERYGVKACGVAADVSKQDEVRHAVDEIEAALPQIVGLANIAGVSSPIPYLELTSDEWRRVIDIDLNGVHYVTRRVVESMVQHRFGRIVSVSSVSAQAGGGTFSKTPYSTAKAGILGLTRSLARELGPYDITVNAVSPGPIDTDIMGGTLSEDRKSALIEGLVVNRLGSTLDVAQAVAFLICDNGGYITGHTLNVDGGLYMH